MKANHIKMYNWNCTNSYDLKSHFVNLWRFAVRLCCNVSANWEQLKKGFTLSSKQRFSLWKWMPQSSVSVTACLHKRYGFTNRQRWLNPPRGLHYACEIIPFYTNSHLCVITFKQSDKLTISIQTTQNTCLAWRRVLTHALKTRLKSWIFWLTAG